MAESDVMKLGEELTSSETSCVNESGIVESPDSSSSKVSQNFNIEDSLSNNLATESSENKEISEPSDNLEEKEPEWLDILGSGHLKKKVIVKGKEDSRPRRGETVIIDIVGKLEDGTEFERHASLEICVGDAEVVQGIDYALPLMDEGETAEIIVSPRFGYGSLGDLPRVPKDSTLHFTVSVKEVIDIKDVSTIPTNERLRIGLKKKERGNWWYQRKEFHLAILCYRKALDYFEEVTECNDELNEAKLKTYNNLSVSHFNIGAFDAALQSVNNVLSQEPDNIKAIYRKVKILKSQGEIEAAVSLAKEGLKKKPDSSALQDELNVLLEMKKKSTSAQKVLYRKMFQSMEEGAKKEGKPKTVLSVTWKWLGLITVAVGIIGAAAIKYKF